MFLTLFFNFPRYGQKRWGNASKMGFRYLGRDKARLRKLGQCLCCLCVDASADPSSLFELVYVDILKAGLTRAQNMYACVMIDQFSRWLEATPLRYKTAEMVAKAVVDNVILTHGAPRQIQSDQGFFLQVFLVS